jgi:hypothetical protein
MSTDMLRKISDEIERLPESKQLLLASRILNRLVNQWGNGNYLDLRDLRNTGEGTWSKEDVQEYIDRERGKWER